MKWLVTMTYLNGGLMLVCFGQMTSVNECNQPFQKTLFYGGAIGIGLAAALITIPSAFIALVEFIRKLHVGKEGVCLSVATLEKRGWLNTSPRRRFQSFLPTC
jgi:hypothetical protein